MCCTSGVAIAVDDACFVGGNKIVNARRSYLLAAALAVSFVSPSRAQVLQTAPLPVPPPWIAQHIFEPSLLPQLTWPWDLGPVAPEDTPVRTRQQPGYELPGLRYGAWMFDPSLTAGGFFDSNVYSSNTNKQSDFASFLAPSLHAYTLWGGNSIDLQGDVQNFRYLNHPGLDETDATFKGSGQYYVTHDGSILTSFQAASLHEGVGTLSSPTGAVQPTPYDLFSADITYRQEFNRLATSFGGRIDSFNYGSTVNAQGGTIDQSYRSGPIYTAHSRVDYAFSPMFGVFTAAEVNDRDLRGMPGQPLASDGERVLGGVDVAFTHLITGEFGVGYVRQKFDETTVGTIEGPTYRAMLTWSPTRSIDVHFKAEQLITETAVTTSTGVRANGLQAGVDYEIRRNVVWSGTAAYENEKFFGQTRVDNVYSIDSRLKYLLSRFSYLSVFYTYVQRDSNMPTFSFNKQQVGINVTAQF